MTHTPPKLEYEVLEGWERLPEGWSFVEVAGVAVDSRDRVYVFNRGAHPVIVFDKEGTFLTAWGEGVFTSAHGIFIDHHDHVWCADNFDHTVRKFTTDGDLLMTLGDAHAPADTGFVPGRTPVQRSSGPFNMVTNVAVTRAGDLFIADGYGNARVHHFTGDGQLVKSWGGPGSGAGEFNLPHGIAGSGAARTGSQTKTRWSRRSSRASVVRRRRRVVLRELVEVLMHRIRGLVTEQQPFLATGPDPPADLGEAEEQQCQADRQDRSSRSSAGPADRLPRCRSGTACRRRSRNR